MGYADRDKYGIYRGSSSAGPGPALMGADTLIGDGVVNAAEEDLGDIKEIMLDMQTGQVAYAVLAFGGFLGMGEKLFAVPWQALHLDTVNKRFVLNVDKDRLKGAPGFDKDSWPDMSDMSWASGIHSFYGTDVNRSSAPTMGPGVPMGGMVGGSGTGSATYAGGAMGSTGGGAGSGLGSSGAGGSVDPRPGNLGDDSDISKIRGSNIG
ncbi:PRC-barrel domain-containing protein [Massilia sp.]|uniref:PRC-barrel domain-containing protein n=1 Tax=Massilia sp. TaxID=1882437 RepID=UPI00289C298E|nr:PRC-barrel domain-containing protein [Massilia sp.]